MNKPKTPADYANYLYTEGRFHYSSKQDIVRLKKIAEFVGTSNKVLDIGCYDGTLGEILIKNNNKVFGIEINQEVAKIATNRGLIVKSSDFGNGFEFEDDYFDVVVAAEVIEHILDTDFFLNEIKRVIKPHGCLIISTPNVASLGRRLLLFFGRNPYFEASLGYPPEAIAGHIRFFTKGLLLDYLKHNGFYIEKVVADSVNFESTGKISSTILANLFPSLSRTIIVKAYYAN